jgi:hypothetical protein
MSGASLRSTRRWRSGTQGARGGMAAVVLLAGCASGGAIGEAAVEPRMDDEVQVAGAPDRYRVALRLELARAYFEQGVPALAAAEARAALALDPASRDAAHLLALLAVQGDDVELAGTWFLRALAAPGAAEDRVLRENYRRFACERPSRQASELTCPTGPARGDDLKSDVSGLQLLRARSIAMDNSAAFGINRRQKAYGRTGKTRQAAGDLRHHRIRQKNSSEESRDE